MRGFVRTSGRRRKVLFIGFAIASSKSGYHTPLLAGIGRLLLLPIVRGTNGSAWIGRMLMLWLSRWLVM